MASEDRPASDALTLQAALRRDVHAFDFFQALRRLECAHPDAPRIGLSERPGQDPLRLAQDPSLAFAASTLARLQPGAAGGPDRLVVNFLGLLGPNGPLPLHLTEYADERLRHAGDPTLVRFLDVFHHRMLSLFYRAWAINRPTVSYDRPRDDRFSAYVGALFGLGCESLRDRDALPDLAKLYFAGRLANQTRHPEGLQAMLGTFFGLPFAIREFVGAWVALPKESRCRPGLTPAAAVLGESAVAGAWMWGAQHRFRIVLGAIGIADFRRFLPGNDSLARMAAMVRLYVGDALDWDLMLILRRDEVPAASLDGRARLGLTTWIGDAPRSEDACDLILAAHHFAAATAARPHHA